MSKVDKNLLISLIEEKFGTQRELAKALGISEDNLSHKLNRQSGKFMKEVAELGIKIRGDQINQNIGSISQQGESEEMIGNAGSIGTINGAREGSVNSRLVQVLEKTVDSDKKTIEHLHAQLRYFQETVEIYRDRLKKLEEHIDEHHDEIREKIKALVKSEDIILNLSKALGDKESKKIISQTK